jgi:PTH1 family peptidyl-tRNA hydrolase
MRFFKIEPAQLLVVHDELDLAPGVVKMKRGGGTGGHNGLSDIAEALDTKDFWRLRVGIGHPGDRDVVADYVLDRPRRAELDAILPTFERSYDLPARIAKGKLQEAIAWLHTSPEDEAKRAAILEARKNAVPPAQAGAQTEPPKEKP